MKHFRDFFLASSLFVFSAVFVAATATAQVVGLSGWDIYIDQGHSRTENKGVFGYSEAEKNLRVGLALQEMLLETTDIDTVYVSRTNDQQSVSLSQRSDHANSLGASWFHSIHSNAGSPNFNSTLMLWGQLLSGVEKSPPGGKAMSNIMIDLLTRGMRTTSSGSRGDCGFYRSFIPQACSTGGPYLSVNRRTTMPSELSEAGFHTSPLQNPRNMNADWKRLEARAFYWSILGFHNLPRPSERIVTGFVTNIETGLPLNGALVTLNDRTYTTDTYESLFNLYSTDPDQLRNGFFFFEDLPDGLLSISVTANGFRQYDVDFSPVDTFFTFQDVQLIPAFPPQVVDTSPLPDSTHRVVDNIIIDFSRVMDRNSVEAAFSLQPATIGSFSWKQNDFQMIFNPDALDPLTEYTLTISESAEGIFGDELDGDGDGNSGGDFVLTFRTGFPDVLAPAIRASYPRFNAREVERDPIITFTYDEPIDPASIVDNLAHLEPTVGGAAVPGILEHYIVDERSLLTYFPETLLEAGTFYRFTIAPGVRDVFGNEETSIKQIIFKTGYSVYDRTSIDSFDNALNPWWEPQQSGSTTGIITDSTGRAPDSTFVNLLTRSTGAMRIDYGWDTSAPAWLIRTFLSGGAPRNVLFDSTYALQAYVFGDGSGNLFRFAVDDNVPAASASFHEVSPWFTIDWYGWRLVSWLSSRDGVGAWIGNGSLDGTLRFDSIQLSHTPGSPAFGTLYVDDLHLAKVAINTASLSAAEVPAQFRLYQNYPNPFNPTTTLRFDLVTPGLVSLKIYNVLGAEVVTLTDQEYYSGIHTLTWDASGLTSGVYFARLNTALGSQSIKLLLIK
ncbi:MAG: hypothetical protein BMS9Abin05_0792 [Rhodothermia bacterium]|nr:MAG: hypothetical protein BMS9Abin05_0792 [Rhodothermia bacterium]